MSTLMESKDALTDFYKRLEATRVHEDNMHRIHNSREAKLTKIHQETDNLKEACARDLFSQIYRDALPIENEFKAAHSAELDNGVISFIVKRTPGQKCFEYITESKKKGSIPAANMKKAIEETVNTRMHKFYEELEETDIEDIKVPDSERSELVQNISIKMDYPEISRIIQENVQKTVQDEIQRSKAEKERMEQIEQQLASNEEVATEESVNEALSRAGMAPNSVPYQPSLFTGIMMSEVSKASKLGMDDMVVEKKAFVESVKEFTKYSMLSVMDLEKFDDKRVNALATQYARETM